MSSGFCPKRDEDSLPELTAGGVGVGCVWTIMSQSWLFILGLSSAPPRLAETFSAFLKCLSSALWHTSSEFSSSLRSLRSLGELWHFLWPVLMFWPSNLMMLNGVAVDCRNMRAGHLQLATTTRYLPLGLRLRGGRCEKAFRVQHKWQQIQFVGWAFRKRHYKWLKKTAHTLIFLKW